jgi:hypothetical protein
MRPGVGFSRFATSPRLIVIDEPSDKELSRAFSAHRFPTGVAHWICLPQPFLMAPSAIKSPKFLVNPEGSQEEAVAATLPYSSMNDDATDSHE